jgi:hypothetical protein
LKKVAGVNDIEDALQRLDKLEQGELRAVIAQVASDSSALKDGASLLHPTPRLILTILSSGLKRIEGIAQQLVTDRSAHDCLYSRGAIPRESSPTFIGEQLLRVLRVWICPPDPSTNHNIACDAQHERTLVWLFKDTIFKEWESNGSLLWIHGKRTFLYDEDLIYWTS